MTQGLELMSISVVLDSVTNFRNEFLWDYTGSELRAKNKKVAVGESTIENSGKGLFVKESVSKGIGVM